MNRDDVEAFVLAGGRSTRFGSNKALALWGGTPLLERALSAARGVGLVPRVVCSDPEPYRGLAGDFVTSERPGLGPAEALRAALEASQSPWALLLGADMPEAGPRLLRVLLDARTRPEAAKATAICFGAGGRRHPLPGLYHRSLAGLWPDLGEAPALQAVLDRARLLVLDAADLPGDLDPARALRNVNRPEDLAPDAFLVDNKSNLKHK